MEGGQRASALPGASQVLLRAVDLLDWLGASQMALRRELRVIPAGRTVRRRLLSQVLIQGPAEPAVFPQVSREIELIRGGLREWPEPVVEPERVIPIPAPVPQAEPAVSR